MTTPKDRPASRDERRVENEYLFKSMNMHYEDALAGHMDDDMRRRQPLDFFCECSDPDCFEKIRISIEQFKDIHNRSEQFVVVDGHEQTDIEEVVSRDLGYIVVEKHDDIDQKD